MLTFVRILNAFSTSQCEGEPIAASYEPHWSPSTSHWISPKANIDKQKRRLFEDCQVLYSRQICLDQISGVYVSTILVFGRQYITGLRFLRPGGPNVRLGYVISC